MEEAHFRQYLKRAGKQENVIEALVQQVRAFEEYLRSEQSAGLEEAGEEHLLRYLEVLSPEKGRVRIRGLALYFGFKGKVGLAELASRLREIRIAGTRKRIPLREFRGVRPEDAARLAVLGVTSTVDMLRAGSTGAARAVLAQQSGVAPAVILELVRLADLSRIEGVKGIRARLYLDAGVDTLEKLAAWEPQALREMLVEWVARTGFDGIAPLPKELENTIAAARELPRVVEE